MQPTSVLGDVRGFARDYALDRLPSGYVWDLVDFIPRRRGARLDGRGPWKFLTTPHSLAGVIWGGIHAPFRAGPKLLIGAGAFLYDVNTSTGVETSVGGIAVGRQNGVMLRDRVYFADAAGVQRPSVVGYTGTWTNVLLTSGPPASLLAVYKDRLVTAGDPAHPQRISFSPLEDDGGPPGTWDAISFFDTSLAITAIWPMGGQILIFHDGSIEKLRGGTPATTLVDTDMYLEPFTDQMGCNDPASIVGWQENVIWATARGIYLSDGATMRSLTEQGGISDVWRNLYTRKRAGTQVVCVVFLNYLFVSVLMDWDSSTPRDLRPFTLVCNLNDRAWYRFANVAMTAAVPSSAEGEEAWWGVDGYGHSALFAQRLARLSPMLFAERDPIDLLDVDALAFVPEDAIDGNDVAVLPQVETGWLRLGEEGVKRFRHILVSHTTTQVVPTSLEVLQVSYRLRPWPFTPYALAGSLPGKDDYKRNRIRLGKRGYGVAVKVQQIQPTYLSRLHDVAVDTWPQDRGKL